MKMPKVWEILEKFKSICNRRGWKASENEDLIRIGDEYHNFLYVRDIPLSSFKKIASSRKCAVQEGLSYRVVEAAYTAWLFLEPPSKALLLEILENPEFYGHIALYDLSPLLEGKNLCAKINETGSLVFQEFENFLERELNVKFEAITLSGGRLLLNDVAVES
ncbi:MAG: hypothetical protein ACPL0C_04910 [Candidatus Bathyarchaeales archaeon]